jgi:molecular chaperone GrpE
VAEAGRQRRKLEIKVQDKRRAGQQPPVETPVEQAETPVEQGETPVEQAETQVQQAETQVQQAETAEQQAEVVEEAAAEAVAEVHDYLDDLRRLQAEFDNYRKRVLREQSLAGERATSHVVERLLPVLDNFERAVEHGPRDTGLELILKDLQRILEDQGLREIPAEGRPFDPQVHEAVESVEDPAVTEAIVRDVYRKGYRLRDRVLRPSMVVVARPVEDDSVATPSSAAQG